MPVYEIYRRDGTPIRVEGPEGATTRQLLQLYRDSRTAPTPAPSADQTIEQLKEIARQRPGTFSDQAGELFKGIGSGVVGLGESALLGAATLLPEEAELAVRKDVQAGAEGIQSLFTPDINIGYGASSIPRKFGEALGSFAGIAGTAIVNPVAAGALAVGAGAGEASERARESDATPRQRATASGLGAIVGASELISPLRLIRSFKRGVGGDVSDRLLDRGKRIFAEAGVEGLQEFAAAVGQNLIEQGIYNPEQGAFEGSGEAFGLGAGVGGFVQTFVEMIAPRRRGRPKLGEDQEQGEFFDEEDVLGEKPKTTVPQVGRQGELFGDVDLGVAPTTPDKQPDLFDVRPVDQTLEKQLGLFPEEAPTKVSFEEALAPLKDMQDTNRLVKQAKDLRDIISQGQKQDTAMAGAMVDRAKKDLEDVNRQISAIKSKEGFDPAEKQLQEQQFKQVEEALEKQGKTELTGFEEQADELNLNEDSVYVNVENVFTGDKDEITTKDKRETDRTGVSDDVGDGRRQATRDTTGVGPLVGEGLEDVGEPISADPRGEGQRATALTNDAQNLLDTVEKGGVLPSINNNVKRILKENNIEITPQTTPEQAINLLKEKAEAGLTATETGKSFIFGKRKGEVTKKALSTQDSKNLAKFLPLSEKEINARINKLNTSKDKGETTLGNTLIDAMAKERMEADFRAQDKKSRIAAKEREEAEAKKKQKKLEDKLAEEYDVTFTGDTNVLASGQALFTDKFQRQEVVARDKFDKQFKDRFAEKSDIIKRSMARRFVPKKIVLVRGDKKGRFLESVELKDPSTSRDKKLILDLLESKPKAKDKEALSAKMYFDKVGSILQGLEQIVYDAKYQKEIYRKEQKDKQKNPEILEDEKRVEEFLEDMFAQGSGAQKARQAIKWMKANLTDATNDYVANRLSEETIKKNQAEGVTGNSLMYLPSENISELAYTLSPDVRGLLEGGDLKNALSVMPLPKTIRNLGKKLSETIGDTKINVVPNLPDNMVGSFDPRTNTIEISETEGMNSHVLLHEAVHAVTSATLANKSHPLTKELNTLYNDVKGSMGTARGSENLDEFVSEAFSNPEFQAELASINPKGNPINGLQRFINAVANFIRRKLGVKVKKTDAFSEFSDHIEGIMAPAPKYRDANKLSMLSTKEGASKYMKTWSKNLKDFYKGSNGDPSLGQRGKNTLYEMSRTGRALSLQALGSQALGDVARDAGYGQLGLESHEAFENQRGDMDGADKTFTAEAEKISKWFEKNPKLVKHLDNLVYHPEYGATLYQVDPNKKESDYVDKQGVAKTIDGNSQVEAWRRGQQDWNKLGKDGQEVFNRIRAYYTKQFDKLQQVLYGEIDSTDMDKESKDALKNDVFRKLFEKNKLNVYFPLMRDGKYKLSYELKDKEGIDPYVVQMFQTKEQRDIEIKRVKDNNIAVGEIKTSDTLDIDRGIFNNAPSGSFISDVLNILDAGLKGDPETKKTITDQFISLYINTLPETSFARSLQPRKGNPGYNTDVLEAFRTKGFDLGRQIARISNGAKLRQKESQIRAIMKEGAKNAKIPKSITGRFAKSFAPTFEAVGNELLQRINFASAGAGNKNFERFVKTANQTAFIYTIGTNPSSAVVNLTQVPVFVYPYLSGQFGIKNTSVEMGKAYKLVQQSGRSLDSFYDLNAETGELTIRKDLDNRIDKKTLEKIKPLVKMGLQRGQLNRSFIADVLGLNERGRKQQGSVLDRVSSVSAIMFNAAERLNRQVTMLMSYNLVLDKLNTGKPFPSMYEGKTVFPQKMSKTEINELAAREALYMTQQTNGGAVLETAPRIAQQGLGRVAMMYKTFGAQMYYTMLKTAKIALDSDKSLSSEERRTAFKQLVGLHGTAFFVAGIHGLPLYGAIKVITNMFLDDDEDDFDTLVRKQFGELGYKGFIAEFTGVDVSDRVKMTGLLFQENRYNADQSAEEIIGGVIGGPFLSVVKKLGRGVNDIREGEYERAFESLVPTGVANFVKASPFGRVGQEGYLTRRGDPIYDDVTGGQLIFQMFGFPPTEYTFRQEKNQDIVALGKGLSSKRSKLLKELYITIRNFDYEGEDEVRKKIDDFNNKVFNRFPGAIIDAKTEKRSIKTHQRTTEKMYNGVVVNPLIQEALEELEQEYE
tara:strand:+ start:1312 stop:7713 length:6402 start_codon:yes stop_codon:yes gene_type:complete